MMGLKKTWIYDSPRLQSLDKVRPRLINADDTGFANRYTNHSREEVLDYHTLSAYGELSAELGRSHISAAASARALRSRRQRKERKWSNSTDCTEGDDEKDLDFISNNATAQANQLLEVLDHSTSCDGLASMKINNVQDLIQFLKLRGIGAYASSSNESHLVDTITDDKRVVQDLQFSELDWTTSDSESWTESEHDV